VDTVTILSDWPGRTSEDIVAASPAMRELFSWVKRIGPTDVNVLLTGDTGTGKEVVAAAVHQISARRDAPFVAINAAALPDSLVESELFGHVKGAFTGAFTNKPGLFEVSNGGTLFLDEIGEMALSVQARLLRALDKGEVRRVGDSRCRRFNVRVISATNRDLEKEVSCGRFRSDLYFRLRVSWRHIPPLRDRPEDLEALVGLWLPQIAKQYSSCVQSITPDGLKTLHAHQWPGNVRELRNVLEHLVATARTNIISSEDVTVILGLAVRQDHLNTDSSSDERQMLISALEEHHWSHVAAARSLGISRSTLWRRLRKLGLH
jgi:transcriptional regulator with PAS, ATPase and Fis domain